MIGRRTVLVGIAVAGLISFYALGLTPASMVPTSEELGALSSFLSRALTPALTYEAAFVPADAPPLLFKAADAARRTLVFATASMSLALIGGLFLGFFASTAWWRADIVGSSLLTRTLFPAVYAFARVTIALMRSVHELLWAVIFLVAIGLTDLGAVIATAC